MDYSSFIPSKQTDTCTQSLKLCHLLTKLEEGVRLPWIPVYERTPWIPVSEEVAMETVAVLMYICAFLKPVGCVYHLRSLHKMF